MSQRTVWFKVCLIFSALLAVMAGVAATALASITLADLPVDEVVVRLRPGVSPATVMTRYSATELGRLIENNVYFLKLPSGSTASALLPILNADPDLFYAEPNYYAEALPNGTQRYISGHGNFPVVEQRYISGHSIFLDAAQNYTGTAAPSGIDRWAWNSIRLADAQKISTGQGVIVAVLDSGLAADHPLLNSNLIAGYDFVGMSNRICDFGNNLDDDGDGQIDEGTGHGTHISGIIASAAPGVQIMPIRVLNSDGVGTYWEVAAGIRFAVDHGAKVINLSLSAPLLPPSLQEALDYAAAHNVIVVAAAGTGSGPNYPAAYASALVLGVGASDRGDVSAPFSGGRSIDLDVYAPGADIYSSHPYNGYVYGSGTSMAAAEVTAEAALLRARYPTWTAAQVTQRIISKVAPVAGTLPGRIDLAAALSTGQEAQYQIGDIGSPDDNSLKPRLQIVNHTAITLPLSELKLRYWYTNEGDKPQSFWCDYSPIGCGGITGSFVKLSTPQPGADTYLEVGFTSGAGVLAPGKSSGEIVARVNKADWSSYNETGDYSYDPARTTYAVWSRVTIYRNGQLMWGIEPGGTPPAATATPPATPPPATPPPAATQTPVSTAMPVASYAVNSGGSASGAFGADAYVSGGNTHSTDAAIDTGGVSNPAPQAVYQTERWSSTAFTYTLSSLTPGRSYLVRLHFAEIVMGGPNQRQFNVVINGLPLLTNYDVYAAAGARNKAIVYEVFAVANSSGQIVIVFSKGRYDNPKVSGIQLIR